MKELSFYQRFKDDIRSGKKVITIRDQSESGFLPGEQVRSMTNPEGKWIADLTIQRVYPILLNEISEGHAEQENMTLDELKAVIRDIYPDEDRFFVIEFELLAKV